MMWRLLLVTKKTNFLFIFPCDNLVSLFKRELKRGPSSEIKLKRMVFFVTTELVLPLPHLRNICIPEEHQGWKQTLQILSPAAGFFPKDLNLPPKEQITGRNFC